MNDITSVIDHNVECRLKAQKPRKLSVELLLTKKHSNTANQGHKCPSQGLSSIRFQVVPSKPSIPSPRHIVRRVHSHPNTFHPPQQKQQTNSKLSKPTANLQYKPTIQTNNKNQLLKTPLTKINIYGHLIYIISHQDQHSHTILAHVLGCPNIPFPSFFPFFRFQRSRKLLIWPKGDGAKGLADDHLPLFGNTQNVCLFTEATRNW